MRKNIISYALAGLLILIVANAAYAHKLQVFANAEGNTVSGEAYFMGGAKAQGCKVQIFGKADAVLGEGVTDENGKFSLPAQPGQERLVVSSSEGHRAETALAAVEVADAKAPVPPTADASSREKDSQFKQLRQDMARLEQHIRLTDILGGIGYIVGIMGVVMYIKSRALISKNTGKKT
jgi:nickel transport protein